MKLSDDEYLKRLEQRSWRQTPWNERASSGQKNAKQASWFPKVEAWVLALLMFAPMALSLWHFINNLVE